MPPFNIVIPPIGVVAVKDFGEAADRAMAAYRNSASAEGDKSSVPEEQFSQLEACVESAKALVASGLVGGTGVYAVLGGNANPDHLQEPGKLESLISIGIFQRPTPVIAEKPRKRGGGSNG